MNKRGVAIFTIVLIAVGIVAVGSFLIAKPSLSPPSINKGSPKSFERDPCATILCPQGFHCVSDSLAGSSGARCVPDTHLGCVNQACTTVNGSGNDTCLSGSDCIIPNETHTTCSGNQCLVVQGPGVNQCASNSDCIIPNETHTICSNEQCVSVSGPGTNRCSTNFDCMNQTNTTLPDLVVLSVNSAWTGNQSGGGNESNQTFYEIFLWANVKNIGQASAPSSETLFAGGIPNTVAFTQALAPGQTGVASVVTPFMLPAGDVLVSVHADWNGQITESNENNNDFSQYISVP